MGRCRLFLPDGWYDRFRGYGLRTPESGEVYFSFIKSGGYVPIPEGYEIAGIAALDGVFNKIDGMPPNEVPRWGSTRPPLIKVEGGKIIPADLGVINQPYVVKFKKTEG